MLSSSWTALFVFALALDVGFCATKEYTVNIGTQATIVGYEYDNPSGRLFAGIPYAQSMAGTNRFMPTQRKDPSGKIDAFHWGSSCMQPQASPGTSEDCLFFNIYTPIVIQFLAVTVTDLFQQAILGSGNGFSTGWFSTTEHSNINSKNLAVKLGCITAANWDAHNLVQMVLMKHCLQIKTTQEIQDVGSFIIPVIDGPGGLFPDKLEVLATRRLPIPILMGNDHDEYFSWRKRPLYSFCIGCSGQKYLLATMWSIGREKQQRDRWIQYSIKGQQMAEDN